MVEAPLAGRLVGEGPPVLFIHGLVNSRRIFGDTFEPLSPTRRLAYVDLAGYGDSMRHPGPYGIEAQVEHVRAFRDAHLPPGPVTLVGYSFGSLVALAAAARWTDVSDALAVCAPVYPSPAEGRLRLREVGRIERLMADRDPLAEKICRTVCQKPGRHWLVDALHPHIPSPIVLDYLRHSYRSVTESFESLIEEQRVPEWLASARPRTRVSFLQATEDAHCSPAQLRTLLGPDADVRQARGDHHVMFRDPPEVFAAVSAWLAEGQATGHEAGAGGRAAAAG